MKGVLLIFLLHSFFKLTTSEFTCSIEDDNKVDCAEDIKSDTTNLESNCYKRGCCYKKLEDKSNIPWCYYNASIPTTIPIKIPTTIINKFQPQSLQQFLQQFLQLFQQLF